MAEESNNRRIAKNTFFLYIRMFILLAVGLYTARVVLEALGETDYGIYNIIGGVVILFSFLNQALTAATQRFLNFHLGREEYDKVSGVFCMSMNAYFILSAVLLVLAETIGLWFVNTHLNIPTDRMVAANWVYQLTIVTFIINLLRIPYNASIIAYEKMDFFAYLSLIEVFLKLGVVYIIMIVSFDRLIFFTALYTVVPLIINIIYKIYCNRKFTTTKYKLMWLPETFRSLFSFSGWSLFGSMANVAASQGLNILINIFFGVVANAAVGIANNVSSHVMQFVTNFQTAFQPQIVKNYAAGKKEELEKLIHQSAKFSFYLIYIVSIPLILATQSLLDVWLTEVPPNTAIFCQLILGFMIIEALSAPLWMTVQATGKIRAYQLLMSVCILSNFPLTYLAFECGMPVYTCWIIRIIVNIVTYYIRCVYMKRKIHFNVHRFLKNAILPIIKVCLLSLPIPILISIIMDDGLIKLFVVVAISVALTVFSIYKLGLTVSERHLIGSMLKSKLPIRKK